MVAASPQPVILSFYPVRASLAFTRSTACSQASLAFTQDVDDVPEMLHRGGDGLHSIVKL